jgi:hypothetical protein
LFCSKVAWPIGPDIFRGNCPLGDFKGRYAGRISRQNWKSLIFQRKNKLPPSNKNLNGGVAILLKKISFG